MAVFYINDTLGNEYRFRHDSLGRKIQLEDPDVGTYYYKYDLTGNLVQQVGGGGNLITGDGFYREYNELNQLIRVRNGSNSAGNILEEYTYDPNGDRVKIRRYDSANTTVYTPYKEWTRIVNISGSYDFTYIYDGSTLVGRINPDGSKHYFHDDNLGSVSLITNQSGAIIEQTFFEPFGLVEEGGTAEDKLYTGQFSDDATGQYYYGSRYYLHIRGQFGQPDPIIKSVYDPQTLNRYSYVRNNPYINIDPTGNIFLSINPFSLVLGQNTATYNPWSNPILGQKEFALKPGEQAFRQGKIVEQYREQGYKFPEEFPEGHWIRNLLDKFRFRGMGRESPDGTADIARWDDPHGKYPYKHVNKVKYQNIDNKPTIVSPPGSDPHTPFYSNLIASFVQRLTNGRSGGGGGGPTSNSNGYFINPRTGAKVPLLPGEGYNPKKDEITH